MANFDIRSNLLANVALNTNVTANGTTTGFIIDTANFDIGFMYEFLLTSFTDGSYTFVIEDGEDPALADAAPVPTDQIIGSLADITLIAAAVDGDKVQTVGVFSNRRFLRVSVVAAGVTTGAVVTVIAAQSAELVPVDAPDVS